MEFIDLTHMMETDMPVFPGIDPPVFTNDFTIEKHGFREKNLNMYSHTGTHMDAPAHILENGRTLDELSLSQFYGKGIVIKTTEPVINADFLRQFEKALGSTDFILLNTGWPKYWGTESYFENFPVLSTDAAEYIASFSLKGFGVDTVSVDPAGSTELPVHNILLKKGMVIIENLVNLEKLPDMDFTFLAFPLKIKQGDGSPVRAVARINT